MQAYGSGVLSLGIKRGSSIVGGEKLMGVRTIVRETVREKGIRGLYSGYQSTLMRNVPSAVMRFALYEELKLKWLGEDEKAYSGA